MFLDSLAEIFSDILHQKLTLVVLILEFLYLVHFFLTEVRVFHIDSHFLEIFEHEFILVDFVFQISDNFIGFTFIDNGLAFDLLGLVSVSEG